jgi:flagellar assembly factor FliW
MQIETALLGEITIEKSDIIHFPEAIPGFPEEKQFILIPLEEDSPFMYLQSVKTRELCLIVANPFAFFIDYEIKLDEETLQKLAIEKEQPNVAIYTILTIPEDFKKTTANLLGPIVININNKKGLQFIAQNSDYNTKHFIFPPHNSENVKPATRKEL